MATRSRFFDSVGGDRIYASDAWAQVFGALTSNGYAPGLGNQLAVSESSPQALSVRVNTGAAWVQGRYFEVYTAQETVALDTAHPTLPRIDRIVVRLDLTNREIVLDNLTGTAAVSPSAPALTRNSTVYELSLARVAVAAGATTITNANITDERSDATVMGRSESPDLAAHDSAATLDHPDSSVTTAKIADLNVTTGKLAAGAVTTAKIADANVTTAKIADGSITQSKMAADSVINAALGTGAVTDAKISYPLTAAVLTNPTITGWTNANHDHSNAAAGGSSLAPLTSHAAATVTHGRTSALVGVDDAQTLNNKTLVNPVINGASMNNPTVSAGSLNTPFIELRSVGGTPGIDFSNEAGEDYDVRLILSANDTLALQGGNLAVEAGYTVDGVDISAHAANASAHHSSTSNGLALTPSTVDASGDITAAGGFRHSLLVPWNDGGETGVNIAAIPVGPSYVASDAMLMARSGSVTSIAAITSGAGIISGGTISFTVVKNATTLFSTTIPNGDKGAYSTQSKDAAPFAAGDYLTVRAEKTGAPSLAGGNVRLIAMLGLEF